MNDSDSSQTSSRDALISELTRGKIPHTIPSDDRKVREMLQSLKEPQSLFGETAKTRQERLRKILNLLSDDFDFQNKKTIKIDEMEEEMFTQGSHSLVRFRKAILCPSLKSAESRLNKEREDSGLDLFKLKTIRQEIYSRLKSYESCLSQVGDDRPLSSIKYSPDSTILLTGSFSGKITSWQLPICQTRSTYKGHKDRVCDIKFYGSDKNSEIEGMLFASCSSDSTIKIWRTNQDTPISSLVGHENRVSNIEFHPNSYYLGSASYDGTWKLWDIETTEEVSTQYGHSREIHALDFQCDGSLCATGGLDGIAKMWDLRSGTSIGTFQGHLKEIYGVRYSPNGYELASCSGDNSIKIWDIRKLSCVYTIPAHQNLISDISFYSGDAQYNGDLENANKIAGKYLVSSAFDGTCKIWSSDDWRLVKTFKAHEGKIMAIDISNDNKSFATAGYDRTFKIWTQEGKI